MSDIHVPAYARGASIGDGANQGMGQAYTIHVQRSCAWHQFGEAGGAVVVGASRGMPPGGDEVDAG
jgi:hypothetical protein